MNTPVGKQLPRTERYFFLQTATINSIMASGFESVCDGSLLLAFNAADMYSPMCTFWWAALTQLRKHSWARAQRNTWLSILRVLQFNWSGFYLERIEARARPRPIQYAIENVPFPTGILRWRWRRYVCCLTRCLIKRDAFILTCFNLSCFSRQDWTISTALEWWPLNIVYQSVSMSSAIKKTDYNR